MLPHHRHIIVLLLYHNMVNILVSMRENIVKRQRFTLVMGYRVSNTGKRDGAWLEVMYL